MKVQLIDYTGKGRPDERRHAANVLVFTKSTRLNMSPGLFATIQEWTDSAIEDELVYMSRTIPSSWEFVDLTFLVSDVSRACAQQMTRTRTASYAMQSQRVTDVSDAVVINPCVEEHQANAFGEVAARGMAAYSELLQRGLAPQDARGVLPINVACNLVCKYNLRNFVELVRARESLRTQGEYADVISFMKECVLEAWPWSEHFFVPPLNNAIKILEEQIEATGLETGKGLGWELAKVIDLLRKS